MLNYPKKLVIIRELEKFTEYSKHGFVERTEFHSILFRYDKTLAHS